MNKGKVATQTMIDVAEKLVRDLASQGIKLDYSPKSLEIVDYIVDGYGVGKASENGGLIELVGAYFGEVLRRNLAGVWYEQVPPDGATGLHISERGDVWAWPHSTVHKKLQFGNKSLRDIYRQIAAAFSQNLA